MADNFDAEEIIYDMIKNIGVSVIKGRMTRDQKGEYINVRSNGCNHGEIVNIPRVNVNIYVPRTTDGLVNRARIKAIRTLVYNAISAADDPEGYYCIVDQSFSALLEDVRKGYDCFTIRYELTLNT